MLICYKDKKFSAAHTKVINDANEILDDYERQGFKLSLRQLYYQFVSKNLIENTDRSYKRLGSIINDARLAGLISWTQIEDRGRSHHKPYSQPDPSKALDGIEFGYSEAMWADQDYYVEVWVEKDALSSVIERPCDRWQVPYMACKGYMSASAQWRAGRRFMRANSRGKTCVLLHLGDHDPSGLDMTRDNKERIELFSRDYLTVRRLALNMDQVTEYTPPPNPAKVTDSRAAEYIKVYGDTSWELDALTPSVIDDLIDEEIRDLIDIDMWNDQVEIQEENRARLAKISANADRVFEFVDSL